MTWKEFFAWLEKAGIHYTPGDLHYEGRGFWYPRPPDITTGAVAPKPPEPWIHVFQSSVETGKKTIQTVDVLTSFSPPQHNVESPEEAKQAVLQALMDMDVALGAEPLRPEMRSPSVPEYREPDYQPMDQEAYDRMRAELEAEWDARHGPVLSKQARAQAAKRRMGAVTDDDIGANQLDHKYRFEVSIGKRRDGSIEYVVAGAFLKQVPFGQDDRVASANFSLWDDGYLVADDLWVHSEHQRRGIARRMYEMVEAETGLPIRPSSTQTTAGALFTQGRSMGAVTDDDSDVSGNCDLGAHERCSHCGCGCHIRHVWNVYVDGHLDPHLEALMSQHGFVPMEETHGIWRRADPGGNTVRVDFTLTAAEISAFGPRGGTLTKGWGRITNYETFVSKLEWTLAAFYRQLNGFGGGDVLKICSCGKEFSRGEWEGLPLKGHQIIDADEEGPAEKYEVKDCSSCFSTLLVPI